MTLIFRRLFALAFTIMAVVMAPSTVSAQQMSKAQIEAFKKLPAAQQQALAKQYGVDLSVLRGGGASQSNTSDFSQQSYLPRKDSDEEDALEDFDQKFAPKSKELERYGIDLFAGEPTTFEPLQGVPVPADYLIGAGDSLKVILWGKVNDEYEVTVNRDGLFIMPNLPPIPVVGMRVSEAKELIVGKVKNNMIGTNASISMGALRSIRVSVMGESYKPGAYTISSLSSMTHALMASGGVSDIGSLRNIQLKRAGQVVSELDLYDLLIRGDNSNDALLRSGDVVFIPTAGDLVSVSGQVRREAVYELKGSETFADLIAMAGGFHSTAYPTGGLIERFSGGNLRTLVNLDLSQTANMQLRPVNGDKLNIPAVSEQYKEAVTVIGAVVRPGKLQWRDGLRISNLLTSVHGDLLTVADLSYALVVREVDASGNIEVIQFNPIEAIAKRTAEHNILLQPRDKLIIFSRFETIEAQNRMLDKYAYTEEELNEREQNVMWETYQQEKFREYVGAETNKRSTENDLNALEFRRANRSLLDITRDKSVETNREQEYGLFSRRRLLAPIILRLKEQATAMNPVQLVEVDGHVKYPGVYPLQNDGTVGHLISAAGGAIESAFLERAELTRVLTQSNNTAVEHIDVNLVTEMNQGSSGIKLRSKDRLNILSIPNWQENVSVKLSGEVKFPGTYTIRRGESMSNVIERAGGFTDFAMPRAAVFSRESLKVKERQHLSKLAEDLRRNIAARSFQSASNSMMAQVSYDDTKKLLEDLSSTKAVGRLVIDLDKVYSKEQDIQLENGDHLHIPQLIQSVNVIGEVNVATAHMYESGVTVDQYIERSGGFKQRADESSVYIIKANGAVVIPNNDKWFAVEFQLPLEEGDTVVVPMDADHMDDLTLYSTATQILYQIGIAAAAIGSL